MRYHSYRLYVPAVFLFCLSVLAGEMHTWTSRSGAKIEAEFLDVDGKDVVLQKEDGKLLKVKMYLLDKESQALAKSLSGGGSEQGSDSAGGGASAPEGSLAASGVEQFSDSTLPVFKAEQWQQLPMKEGRARWEIGSGKRMGKYVSYKRKTFEAIVDQNGQLWIVLLDDNGEEIPYRIQCDWRVMYLQEANHHRYNVRRAVQKFRNAGQPTDNPKTVKLDALCDDDVEIEIIYEFKDDTVTVSGNCKDPKGISVESTFRIQWLIPSSHVFSYDSSLADIAKAVSHCKLNLDTAKEKKTYNYSDDVDISSPWMKRAEIVGQWRPRVVTFYPTEKDECQRIANYGKVALYNGLMVYNDPNIGPGLKKKLTIEIK